MNRREMPVIPIEQFAGEELRMLQRCIGREGRLRASAPNKSRARRDEEEARIYYLWRMLAFYISAKPEHHCMPVAAEMAVHRQDTSELDRLVEKVLDSIPKEQWYGVIEWGQALGQIGTPRYDKHGAVIYR